MISYSLEKGPCTSSTSVSTSIGIRPPPGIVNTNPYVRSVSVGLQEANEKMKTMSKIGCLFSTFRVS